MAYPAHLLPTTVVGSYPQPAWLVDGDVLKQHGVPRVHAHGIWRVPETLLEQAQDDGTILAIREMELAGNRHRDRRRNPSRELLQSIRSRARWHRR